MPNFLPVIIKNNRLTIQTIKDDFDSRKDKDLFRPFGTQIYVGRQGSGKTLSAVYHILRLKKRYPKCIIVSNLHLSFLEPVHVQDYLNNKNNFKVEKQYILFSSMHYLSQALTMVNNDKFGVIYLIDEIHTYFNALESKNIPMYIFTEISQQRKQRKLIIGTSQLFMRAAKPLREQCDNVIVCSTKFGVFTRQIAYDAETLEQDYDGRLIGSKRRSGWFIHTREIRNAFDTYQKVVSGKDQLAEINKPLEIKQSGIFRNQKVTLK